MVKADIILKFAAITDPDLRIDIDILADDATLADQGADANMGVMPHLRTKSYYSPRLYDGCRMDLSDRV